MIIYDHMRKCGGTCIRWNLKKAYNWCFIYQDAVRYGIVDPTRPLEFFCGHDIFHQLSGGHADGWFFTILRNPVDIVYSGASATHRNAMAQGVVSDLDGQIERRVEAVLSHDRKLDWIWRTKDHWAGLDLARYDFVGVQEMMEESWAVLEHYLQLCPYNQARPRNTSGGPHSHRRKELEELFKSEILIWEAACVKVLEAHKDVRSTVISRMTGD